MQQITSHECSRIAQDLQIRKVQVESVVQLLDEGNTVPFITRYRKERTGGLNEDVIRQIKARIQFLRQLHDRKQTILKTIETQGKLTPELRDAIVKADTTKRLEDLYLPYKPKKRSLATAAREKGLEPLALAVWHSDPAADNLAELMAGIVNPEKELKSAEDVLLGVQHILAELTAEVASVRAVVRQTLWETGKVCAAKNEKPHEGQGLEYKDYFQFTEPARQIPAHRILALNRGEKEGAIKVRLEYDQPVARSRALVALAEHLLTQVDKMPAPAAPAEAPSAEAAPAEAPPAGHAAEASGEAPGESNVLERSPVAAPHEAIAAAQTPTENAPSEVAAAATAVDLPPRDLHGEPLVAEIPFKTPHGALLNKVLDDALQRLVYPSLEREVRNELTDEAEGHAAAVFARNLRSLLLQPPLHQRRILAIDPGFRTGCKLAVIDEYGNLLDHAIIHPFAPLKKGKEKKEASPPPSPTPAAGTPLPEALPPTSEVPVAEVEATPPAATEAAGGSSAAPLEPAGAAPAESAVPATADPARPVGEGPSAEAAPPVPAVDRRAEAKAKMVDLVRKHGVHVVALGNGTGCRETEEIVAEVIASDLHELSYVIVNEAGASVYSVSPVGREEFPDLDAVTRSTVSIGRRLQDPLAELVKVEPQHIGVGLYQHDLGRKELRESLDAVVESCVNQVGVDVNTASIPLLRHVSGLNQMVARDLVEYRKQHGPFQSRDALLNVPGLGPQRYVQAAGFLKIPHGPNPLDRTWIHPESYATAEKILGELGVTSSVLEDRAGVEELQSKLKTLAPEAVAQRLSVGVPTAEDILQSLARPGRDPREELPPPIFKKGILKLEDLQAGMELKGTVLNVVDFGAFVDIGLKDSGLVHISQMANRYIKSPYEVVAVNDVVTVWVLAVDKERNRVSLSMIRPGTERKPLERRPSAPRGEGGPQRGRRGGPREGGAREGGARESGAPVHEAAAPAAEAGRGGRPQRGGRRGPGRSARPAGTSERPADAARPQEARPLPPRKPRREPPRPKLTQEAIEGKVPLRTFGELSALFAAKKKEPPPVAPSLPEAPPPAAQDLPAPGAEEKPAEPRPPDSAPEINP